MARLIAKLLLLIAVLMMPLGMSVTPAAAAHHSPSATMPMQHCPEQGQHPQKAGFVECTMACSAALPAADLPQEEHASAACAPSVVAVAHILHGLHPDTATPPPKPA